MPPILSKTFNIPFSGEAATVVCIYKYTRRSDDTQSVHYGSTGVQYNADGTTVAFESDDAFFSVSVNSGIMTVKLTLVPELLISDCRCCLIPGDPFA